MACILMQPSSSGVSGQAHTRGKDNELEERSDFLSCTLVYSYCSWPSVKMKNHLMVTILVSRSLKI